MSVDITTMSVDTKPLITWSYEVTWQIEYVIVGLALDQ